MSLLRIHLLGYLFVGAVSLCIANSFASDINPNAADVLIEVKSLSLEGFSSIEDYPLNILTVRSQLDQERAKFGSLLTVDELHQIADAMTVYVRRQGFVFHTVYLPPQEVVDGDVRMTLQEGVLSDVHVINNSQTPSHRLERVFAPLVGKLLYAPDVERKVAAIKAQSGIQLFAFYSRGSKPGQARLNLRVEPTKRHFTSLKLDNFGAVASGEFRAIAQWRAVNLTHRFDTLSLAVLGAVDGTSNVYGSLYYSLPTAGLNWIWDISASNNQFELGDRFENLGLEGDVSVVKLGLRYQRRHDSLRRESWRLGFHNKSNRLDNEVERIEQEKSESFTLEWAKAAQWPKQGVASQSSVVVTSGNMAVSSSGAEHLTKFEFNTQWLKGFGEGRGRSVLSGLFSFQEAGDSLPSVEAFSLTGPYGVRGFVPGLFSADKATLVGLEWSFPGLVRSKVDRWHIEPYVFWDTASGEKVAFGNNPASKGEFSGMGGGFRFRVGNHMSGQLYGAHAINGDIDGKEVYGEQIWRFELRLQ